LKKQRLNISLLALVILLFSCNAVKRVADDENLLTKNTVTINDKKDKREVISQLIIQKPNRKIVGIPLRLHLYNTARPNKDSIFESWLDKNPKRRERLKKTYSQKQVDKLKGVLVGFNEWLKKKGEEPEVINPVKTEKSLRLLEAYHINNGWFNVTTDYEVIEKKNKRAKIDYTVSTGQAFLLDSIVTNIKSPVIKDLYKDIKKETLLKSNEQYKTNNFDEERHRISKSLRNSGVYHFNQDYVTFQIDTIGTNKKVNVNLSIQDRAIRTPDSIEREPFQIYKIRDVSIITDYSYENKNKPFQDSLSFNGYNIYSYGKMRYKPRTLTDAIFITPGDVYRDSDRTKSYRHLKELRSFKYPNIEITEHPDNTLSDTILLTPLKKFSLGFEADVSQSNIQSVGFSLSPSLLMRNVFKGSETLEISGKASIGASKDRNNPNDPFFDIIEYGIDLRLTIPRLFSPFYTKHLVPKYMSPTTNITLATTSQTNIGLDKQTFSGVFNYNWQPNEKVTNRLDVFNIQYVQNLNIDRYFNVYNNSYQTLNEIAQDVDYIEPDMNLTIPDGAEDFIDYALGPPPSDDLSADQLLQVNSIDERKTRLTENNLILSSNFSLTIDERDNLLDKDFSIFRAKLEPAGNLLSVASKLFDFEKDASGRYTLFNVAYSQFIKTELEYIKHWDLGRKNILAMRAFFGIAIPYGNSNSIPFSKSFFAGGPNDNRAWVAYSLGPGSSKTTDEFNEANMKIALSVEQRFNIFDKLNGALFVDVGNIWNVLDSETDEKAIFSGLESLKNIAVGTGIGFRYDFNFFVFRLDIGLKTYNPAYSEGKRWFNDYNFGNGVYNIGINYPF
jgi:outer membrane protein assembly factor BamA